VVFLLLDMNEKKKEKPLLQSWGKRIGKKSTVQSGVSEGEEGGACDSLGEDAATSSMREKKGKQLDMAKEKKKGKGEVFSGRTG